MGRLTETEIFDCLAENFRAAADLCDRLATEQRKGPNYVALREALKLIGGASRQAATWREDARWLKIAEMVAEAHRRAGDWLRGVRVVEGKPRVRLSHQEIKRNFTMLAANMRQGFALAEKFRTAKTGRTGMILPIVKPVDRQPGRPVTVSNLPPGMAMSKGGIIMPAGAA
jgi:hypothetical protein